MKKRIAKMMLLAAAAFSLTACGGSGGNQEADAVISESWRIEGL